MCGFIGQLGNLINRKNFSESLESIKHRGPDNLKYFFSESINLGFARLSIQDLGTLSNQPILSPSKKFVLVFNGEIYNHQLLRKYIKRKINKKLLASSNSDTITLLSLFEELGLKKTLNLIKGMFAIAIYYFETDSLYLIRDHFGQKPLYYSSRNSKFIFGSEIKALNYLDKLIMYDLPHH